MATYTNITLKKCPPNFRLYKEMCILMRNENFIYEEAQQYCASKGSIVLPIKDRSTYQFIRRWAIKEKFGNFYVGMNYSKYLPIPIYSDRTIFKDGVSFNFDEDSNKIGSEECVFLKKGVSYKARSTPCNVQMNFFCLWKGTHNFYLNYNNFLFTEPTCPPGFILYPNEEDGRTCYGLASQFSSSSPGASHLIETVCKSTDHNLWRPGLPPSGNVIKILDSRLQISFLDDTRNV